MSVLSPFCTLSSPFTRPFAFPSPTSIKSLAHFLLLPQSLSDALPIFFVLLLPLLLLTLLPAKQKKKNLGASPTKSKGRELFFLRRKTNGSKADVVPLPSICLSLVSHLPRDFRPHAHHRRTVSLSMPMPMQMPMLLFTPSVGFVDLRRKVMSVPNLGDIGEMDELRPNLQSQLEQIPTDLLFTRRRIEAGLREQRKQKDILEHVQDQLLRSRLRHANCWRSARSHSPPNLSARKTEGDTTTSVQQQRPNSFGATQMAEGQRNAEFGIRIGQLEQQLDHLQSLASQTLLARFRQSSPHQKISQTREWHKIQSELAKLRRKLMEHRMETADQLSDFGNELTERLVLKLARRTRRELAHSEAKRRGGATAEAEAEELRKRCALLEEQQTKLNNSRFAAELRVEELETRRTVVERMHSQIWAMLGAPGVAEPERLPSAVRKAIDAERNRWEAEMALMVAKTEAKDRERREQYAEEKKEASRLEAEWTDERMQLRRELERWKAEEQEARHTAECQRIELTTERMRADEAERKAHARVQRAEDEMAMVEEEQRNARARMEAELEAERTRLEDLSTQRTHLEAQFERKNAELRESRADCADALRERDDLAQTLHEAETQNVKANSECEKLKTQLQKERNETAIDQRAKADQLIELQLRLATAIMQAEEADRNRAEIDAEMQQRMAETDGELETLKDRLYHAEQRLRTERETRLADAQQSDKEWEEQERIIGKLEAEKESLQQRLGRLQQSLTRAEAEAAAERRQTEELTEEREKRFRAELDRAKTEKSHSSAELAELRERNTEMEERLKDAEYRLDKAKELHRKLKVELDELSERSVAQNSSTEQIRTELNDTNDQIALLKQCYEEQRRRNDKLEAELVKVEKVYNKEKEIRIKTEEYLKRKEFEANAIEEKRLSEQREFQLAYERFKRLESERNCREEAGRANKKFEEQIHATIDKWGEKIGMKTVPKRTDAMEELNKLIKEIWDKCEQWEKQKEKAEEENNSLNAQLNSNREQMKVQQNELTTREQQINAMRETLTKMEKDAQREKVEKVDLERKLQQWEETVRREKAKMESKLIEEKAEHSKTLIRQETENKFISNSLEELRTENFSLKQKLGEMEKQRIGERGDGGEIARKRETAEAETAILKAELCRERTETNRTHSELREVQNELMRSLQKAERLQMKLDREITERTREKHATDILQKRENQLTAKEAEIRVELSSMSLQLRISAQSEENARRALRESEATCKELNAQLQRAERERNSQKQHIKAMEMDRERVEAVIRKTTLERNALTKALDAMETENAELQRHCNTLQTQVDRIMQSDKVAQKLEEQQKRIHRLEAELSSNK